MPLTKDKVIEECNDLIRFDLDAIGSYDSAIRAIKDQAIRDQLIEFRADHSRHVTELSSVVLHLGGTPSELPGVRGAVRKTLTKVAGLAGIERVLQAMKSNETVLNEQYKARTNLDLPEDVLELVRKNYEDERRHLDYVTRTLDARPWEHAAPRA